jgi:hypothetical protein
MSTCIYAHKHTYTRTHAAYDQREDAVLEQLAEKALLVRTPPKLSHKELLEIAVIT